MISHFQHTIFKEKAKGSKLFYITENNILYTNGWLILNRVKAVNGRLKNKKRS